jgi:hypothetical protein
MKQSLIIGIGLFIVAIILFLFPTPESVSSGIVVLFIAVYALSDIVDKPSLQTKQLDYEQIIHCGFRSETEEITQYDPASNCGRVRNGSYQKQIGIGSSRNPFYGDYGVYLN